MLQKHKLPSLEAGILMILLVILKKVEKFSFFNFFGILEIKLNEIRYLISNTFIVGAGFFTSGGITFNFKGGLKEIIGMFANDNEITGEMVRVTGANKAQEICSNAQITTAEGLKPAYNIKLGDSILSYDEEAGKMVNSTVVNVYSNAYYGCLVINSNIQIAPYQYVYAKRGQNE